jgi:hypothetical protein
VYVVQLKGLLSLLSQEEKKVMSMALMIQRRETSVQNVVEHRPRVSSKSKFPFSDSHYLGKEVSGFTSEGNVQVLESILGNRDDFVLCVYLRR